MQDGNMWQLLKLRRHDVIELRSWPDKTTNYCTAESQKEMLTMMSHIILRQVILSLFSLLLS
jgi:hypothetical protein